MTAAVDVGQGAFFEPLRLSPSVTIANRFVMSAMTRCFCPNGVPGDDVVAYYRRRAEGAAGLIISEGTWVPHPAASNEADAPRFYGEDALAGWKRVLDAVHSAGSCMMPQLWHVGMVMKPRIEGIYDESESFDANQVGPSGMVGGMGILPTRLGNPMTQAQIDAVIEAYAAAAASAHALGFDGVELHGAHGYLIDQFLWEKTNVRSDRYGGSIRNRSAFAAEIIAEIRIRTAPDFPIGFRLSQWKSQDYGARLVADPAELAEMLEPLVQAGVTFFDCSQRRYWTPEFDGSDLNLAGWVKKVSGALVMTVGSVGLDNDLFSSLFDAATSKVSGIDDLVRRFTRGDFDMIAVGRAMLSDPQWAAKVKAGAFTELQPFTPAVLQGLT